MAPRHYRPKAEEPQPIRYDTPLPTHLPVANYYRQSTIAQVGNISTDIQTIDMKDYLKRLGWAAEYIIMIDMDAGVSGTRKIDERPGMSQLFQLITTGKVGAVSCQDEDRLFRDVTQIQVNIFIEACKQHHVLVITPSMIYNFCHEQMGTFHARQFRFKSEMAAEYITAIVRGKLFQAKQRLAVNGRWSGPPIPVGYMIDNRKTLPDGTPNENWRKFAIFEEYAEVAQEYWALFLHYGGQIRRTARHIFEHGPYFPDPQLCKPPAGFQVVYRIQLNHGKWCPGRNGLRTMFTNAMYMGHWVTNDRIVIWNNHPAIIEVETFMRAFHYLSDVTLDGVPNPDYAPKYVHARPSIDRNRAEERPLCLGLIVSQDADGAWLRTGSAWDPKYQAFVYRQHSKVKEHCIWQRRAAYVDDAVTGLLLEKLKATFDFQKWKTALDTFAEEFERQRQLQQAQLEQLRKVMNNLVISLATIQHPQLIAAVEKQYAEAEREYDRLSQELNASLQEQLRREEINQLKESCEDVINDWPSMTPDDQRRVLHLFIFRIEVTRMEGGVLHLRILWQDGSENEVKLPIQATNGNQWLPEELDLLVELMQSEPDQIKVAAQFPERPWEKLQKKYTEYSKSRGTYVKVRFRSTPIKSSESYETYLKRLGQKMATDTGSVPCLLTRSCPPPPQITTATVR